MAAEAGAELTMMENRFVPARFKDGYGPVGAWFLLFDDRQRLQRRLHGQEQGAARSVPPPCGQAAVLASCATATSCSRK
ncbi:MAG: hypothetical protein U1F67_15915 [Rubrivivax sp.]